MDSSVTSPSDRPPTVTANERVTGGCHVLELDPGEDIAVELVPADELLARVQRGEVAHSLILVALARMFDPAMREAWGAAGRDRASASFSLEAMGRGDRIHGSRIIGFGFMDQPSHVMPHGQLRIDGKGPLRRAVHPRDAGVTLGGQAGRRHRAEVQSGRRMIACSLFVREAKQNHTTFKH